MEQAQGCAAGQHQAALSEGLAGGFKEIEFFFQPEFLEVAVAQIVQGGGDFSQVVFDQAFGTHAAVLIKARVGNVAQITVQAFVQMEDQLVHVVAFTGLANLPETVTNQLVIVIGGTVHFLPFVGAGKAVVFLAGFIPFVVGRRVIDGAFELLEGAFH